MRVMLRHILPNVMTPALVVATLELARVIVMDAALSFLGLGVQPPAASWGRMLADAQKERKRGRGVVLGYLEPHGRVETERQAEDVSEALGIPLDKARDLVDQENGAA